MFGHKIKMSDALFEKLSACAQHLGTTVEEFSERVLEREADRVLSQTGKKEAGAAEVAEITNKLKGLGYLE